MTAQVMTANRLDDGAVVYLAPEGAWSERLVEAEVAEDAATLHRLEAEAERAVRGQLVVGPYLFTVALEAEGPRPIGQREIIRAAGPSVGTDFKVVAANDNDRAGN